MLEHPGPQFQKQTAYTRDEMAEKEPDWRSRPATYKFYNHAPVISLPSPAVESEAAQAPSVWECIAQRRSVRAYGATPLTLSELSRLLWACAGITTSYTTPHGQEFFRAAPTAGALYPIETYLVVHKVEDLEPGIYHYRVAGKDILDRPIVEGSHALEQLQTGDFRGEIAAAALDQTMCARAGAVFVWTAVFARSVWKYGDRAYRYVYLDAGHMAAQLSLAAVALGLGSCPVAAFFDQEVNALLGVDGVEESTVYMTTVGRPTRPFGFAKGDARLTARPKE